MQDAKEKTIVLTNRQLNMVHMLVKSAEGRNFRCTLVPTHNTLTEKVAQEKRKIYTAGLRRLCLTPEERRLLRSYNTDYCNILADNDDEGDLENSEVVQIYRLATSVQMLFTSRN